MKMFVYFFLGWIKIRVCRFIADGILVKNSASLKWHEIRVDFKFLFWRFCAFSPKKRRKYRTIVISKTIQSSANKKKKKIVKYQFKFKPLLTETIE